MRRFLFFALILIVAQGRAQEPQARKLILEVLEQQRLAWNDGNIDAYMQGYVKSDSLLFVGKSGPTYGWENTLANYKKGYPDRSAMGTLTFNIKEVKFIDQQNAFVLGAWHLKRKSDEPQGYFTLWLKKINNQWKVIVDHSS